jgi:hypothetical protein
LAVGFRLFAVGLRLLREWRRKAPAKKFRQPLMIRAAVCSQIVRYH